ncbi:hypothetical protein AVEN_187482-1 [Araneus ventricosus]|uniref:Uncharacterized protein n=1 Tax=Araneus ventricosus TaxID=182803 RepID=A0A4Y2BTE6_ARAVE|nr:hypothetical protein AVEN_187482-1 [Araneus ventricosus]
MARSSIPVVPMLRGDADLKKNVDSTEKAQCVAWFIETKSDTQVQRNILIQYGREPLSQPTVCVWYYVIYGNRHCSPKTSGGSPICFRRKRCTWVSDFVSMNQATHTELSPVKSTFFFKSASHGKQKTL